MTNTRKIINDPIYGFITIENEFVFKLIEHPWFQRLRRIKQTSLTHLVYPGALHTRFHHALGALHLMTLAINELKGKGVDITDEEAQAVQCAILLHDIGHGPFSHTLEGTLLDIHHEDIGIAIMQALNKEFDGALDLAIIIFEDNYEKKFLHQLISGQLDMDRLDYLGRDSFYSGVAEGKVSHDRIIKMLNVHNNQLVIEEKGIYSVEKFLIARRLMYWQVYLHKTVLSAEQMLIALMKRATELAGQGVQFGISPALQYFFGNKVQKEDLESNGSFILERFLQLDDSDVIQAIKQFSHSDDFVLKYLSKGILNRNLFKIRMQSIPFERDFLENTRQSVRDTFNVDHSLVDYIFINGREDNQAYEINNGEIMILRKNKTLLPMSKSLDYEMNGKIITKYFVAGPKELFARAL